MHVQMRRFVKLRAFETSQEYLSQYWLKSAAIEKSFLVVHTYSACLLCISHIAPRGAKKEEAFGGVILKSERPSGALFTNSGPPFFTVESKIEVLSPLGTSFH